MSNVSDASAVTEGSVPVLQPESRRYRRYGLWLLVLVYMLNFLDRKIVLILAEPIKADLNLSDWQLGLITGLAFALFYAILGFPFARWAERGDRPLIIAAALGTWSLFTAVCGFAQNFTHLVLARLGVGIGEAGCTPTAVSLIGDITPKEERAAAMSIYTLGSSIGGCLGLAIGGLVAGGLGWRAAFLVAGLPGILVALVVIFTLREPRRRLKFKLQGPNERKNLLGTVKDLTSARSYRYVVAAETAMSFFTFGITAFLGSFFLRNHAGELGSWADSFGTQPISVLGVSLAVVMAVGAAVGALSGGFLTDRFAKKDARAYMVVPAVTCLLAAPFYLAALYSPSLAVSLLSLGAGTALGSVYFGPGYAVIQGVANETSRATATAALIFCTNLIGLGLGPLLVGGLSDMFAVMGGMDNGDSVRLAMACCCLPIALASAFFWTARKTVRDDIRY